ncbi:MAG: pilus assembly protein PilM [Deltaproteobacteria bacterium]|nr:pilus assembly protein PilM [Deltaproteobacteria bacterium]
MAHRILGLDIGARAARLAIVDKTLRQTALAAFDEEPVTAVGGAEAENHPKFPLSADQCAAVRRLLARNLRPDDQVAVALPGRLAMHRALSFPFKDDKAIAEAVGFELENHIPTPIADQVVDFVRTGEKAGQTEVLAIAASRDEVEGWLDAYKYLGLEARHLGLQSLCYAALVARMPTAKSGTTLLCDIGAERTEVAVVADGRSQFLRSFAVGGQTVASAYAQLVQSDLPPEDLWRQHAVLLPDEALEDERERGLARATQQALQPLLREIRLTLSAWTKKARTRPDRMVVVGGLAQLNGLHAFLQRAFDLPVEPVRLGDMPDVRIAEARHISDRAALAVALALSAADPESDHNVDFRQGDLAYEGDYKVLRQRLPQLAAFLVIALCLLGIQNSLSYRALVIEQEQQLTTLQALSKQLTGKAQSDFDAVKRELERAPAVDISGLYPDISAFRALEDLSNLLDKVTEPPEYKPPGGPEEVPPPNPGMLAPGEAVRPPPRTDSPAGSSPEVPAMPPPTFRGLPDIGGGPPAERMPMPGPGGAAPGVPGAGGSVLGAVRDPAAAPAAEGDPKPPGKDGHQIELSSVQIDRNHGTLRGDADTQDALLALQQAVDSHRCFGKVKSSSDRITFERHRDWFKFTVEFEIACPADDVPAKPTKGEAKSDKTDKADAKKADDEDD